MAEHKQGGLGKGLAALIPSGPDSPSRKPRLGNDAADIILGAATGGPAGDKRRVKGAPTIQQSNSKSVRPSLPSSELPTVRLRSVTSFRTLSSHVPSLTKRASQIVHPLRNLVLSAAGRCASG